MASRYEMAQHLNDELDQLEGMLKGHIAKLNASHVRAADSGNPVRFRMIALASFTHLIALALDELLVIKQTHNTRCARWLRS